MKEKLDRHGIAMRVAQEFQEGDVVNLGIGIPTLCSSYIPRDRQVILHSENGVMGFGPIAEEHERDIDLLNAGGQYVTPLPGMAVFSSSEAFAMIRAGRVDITVLGGFQVSERGDLANWMITGRGTGNIGGAMDLVTGARKVIVAMEHTTRKGEPKLVRRCSYPLTGAECVKLVVTDLAVIEVTDQGFLLLETFPGYDPEEIQAVTEATLSVSPDLQEMHL